MNMHVVFYFLGTDRLMIQNCFKTKTFKYINKEMIDYSQFFDYFTSLFKFWFILNLDKNFRN